MTLFVVGMEIQTPLVAADSGIDAWHWVINAITLAVGIGLATWGKATGARPRGRRTA